MLLNSAWWDEMNPIHMLAPSLVELFWEVDVLEEVCLRRLAMMFKILVSFSLSALCLWVKCKLSAAVLTPYIPVHCYASCLDDHVITL